MPQSPAELYYRQASIAAAALRQNSAYGNYYAGPTVAGGRSPLDMPLTAAMNSMAAPLSNYYETVYSQSSNKPPAASVPVETAAAALSAAGTQSNKSTTAVESSAATNECCSDDEEIEV